ncbi:hypothetical protein ABZ754_18505 [Micromonospora purpureochromogenes]|uniref:hypothetical protein n=1 Tax=Micromonospora purpureochromogenes TaxID=47872 RepID=UPI0033F90A85
MSSEVTVVDPPTTAVEDAPPPAPTRRPWRRVPVVLAALVAAWAVPAATHALHGDWLLPPLVLLATASVLRGGRTLLDRLVLALALLLGAATAGGLLFAVWPWGMRPVPLTGLALTVVVLAAAGLRRRPRLPRPGRVDLFPVAGTAALLTYLAAPWQRATDLADQLTILARGEDNWRHLALFDVVGRLGGYAFVDPAAAKDQILSQLLYYPQGWHLVTALLDGFLTPVGAAPRGPAAVDHYAGWLMASFGLLVLVLLWAAHRIAGPVHPLHRVVLTVVVGALILGTQLPRLLVSGYPTEILGLALTVLLAALVGRPLANTREQVVLLAALLVAIGFTYYLFLPPAAVLVLCWVLGHRREALRRWPTVLAVGLLTAPLALVAPLLGVLRAKQTEALAVNGGIEARTEAWRALIWLGGIIGVALLVQVRRADPTWRRWLLVAAIGVALPLGIARYNTTSGVEPGYYFIKSTHLATALLVVGAAAVVRLLPVPRPGRSPRGVAATVAGVLTGVVVMAVAVTLCGVTGWHPSLLVANERTWTQRWVHQDLHLPSKEAWVCAAAVQRYPDLPDTTTIVLDRGPYRGYVETLCVDALHGTTARTEPGVYNLDFLEPERTDQIVRRVSGPIRFITADPRAERRIQRLIRTDPSLRHRVSFVPLTVPECDVLPSEPPPVPGAPPATPAPPVPACPPTP